MCSDAVAHISSSAVPARLPGQVLCGRYAHLSVKAGQERLRAVGVSRYGVTGETWCQRLSGVINQSALVRVLAYSAVYA